MDTADQAAQLAQGNARRGAGFGDKLAGGSRVAVDLLLGHAQAHGQRDQPGLGTVVQIPLDTAQLSCPRVDGLCPGLGQMLHLRAQPGAFPGGKQPAGEPGRTQRHPAAGPPGDHDEARQPG
jgi:hypothetical protein